MRIIPAIGQAFVMEDSEDYSALQNTGLDIPDEARKGVGTTGVIHAITHDQKGLFAWIRHWLFAERIQTRFRIGDRVIFDKFIAQDIYLRDDEGKEVPKLRCLPVDCILGIIQ